MGPLQGGTALALKTVAVEFSSRTLSIVTPLPWSINKMDVKTNSAKDWQQKLLLKSFDMR